MLSVRFAGCSTHLVRVFDPLIRLINTGPRHGENVGSTGAGVVPHAPHHESLVAQGHGTPELVLAWLVAVVGAMVVVRECGERGGRASRDYSPTTIFGSCWLGVHSGCCPGRKAVRNRRIIDIESRDIFPW